MSQENVDAAMTSEESELDATALADLCDALVAAWLYDAKASTKGVIAESQAASEVAASARLLPAGAPANLKHAPEQMAGRMVDAILLLVQSLGTLLRAEPLVTIGIWPVVRAEIEYAGRVAWLLEPFGEEEPGLRRVARALLEQLSGLQRQRFTASKWSEAQAKEFKGARDRLLRQIQGVFDDVHTPFANPGEIAEWLIGGETMMPLGKGAELFFSLNLTNGKALYDILSDFSHPSVISLAMQSKSVAEDGATFWSFPVVSKVLDFQVRLGCIALFKSAIAILNYCGFSSAAINRWASDAPHHWFDSNS